MRPKTLSATSAQVYEDCPARFKAERLDFAPGISGLAADLGSVCHKTLEDFVAGGYHLKPKDEGWEVLSNLYENTYYTVFSDAERYETGRSLMQVWLARTDFSGREVLSTEAKKGFELPTPDGNKIRFNYVMDRVDRLEGGEIEVVDYKTSVLPVQPDDLRHKLQARAYAVAAQLEHPEAPRIWVTFDMLRHEAVGVVFSKEENRATYRYLVRLVERIWNDDKAVERLNEECRWCVRRQVCKALRRHVNAGGPLSLADPAQAADLHFQLTQQKAGIEVMIGDVERFLLEHCESAEVTEVATNDTIMKVTLSGRRDVNAEVVERIIGPDLFARYGKINVSAVDNLLKGSDLTAEQKSSLRQAIGRKVGEPKIKTKAKPPEEFG